MNGRDTIVAPATGSLPCAIAIVRVSGPAAAEVLSLLVGALPDVGSLVLRTIKNPDSGLTIDQGMVVFFRGPLSFTGEDCAEFHLHGSRAVVSALLDCLTSLHNVRLADPGEFTRRAFEAGKLDSTQVEGLGDLISSDTEHQRLLALARFEGDLSNQIQRWRQWLISLLAKCEVQLDFSEESDVGDAVYSEWVQELDTILGEFESSIKGYEGGRIVREGYRVALVGAPNAGKSSILNVLSGSDIAIVTPEPGTTRDIREVSVDINGEKVIFCDSAGLRSAPGLAEAEGVRRTLELIEVADLVLEIVSIDTNQSMYLAGKDSVSVRVGNKLDIGRPGDCDIYVSCKDRTGFSSLLDVVVSKLTSSSVNDGSLLLTRLRDLEAVKKARECISRARALLNSTDVESGLELYGAELGSASLALSRLLGTIDVENVFDELFSSFCIGK